MTEDSTIAATVARLQVALQSGQLPESAQKLAKRLIELLGNPVRVAILGLAGTGKSKLLNFLAGDEIIPSGVDLPTVQLSYGPQLKVNCTLPDGSVQLIERLNVDAVNRLSPVFLHVEMPLPALRKISLLEVVMGASTKGQERALTWTARRADIALWCAQNFNVAERDLWNVLPDTLKDHSFLVVTKADEMTLPGELTEQIEQISDIAEDCFRGIFPLATLQAIGARGEDGTVDKGRLRTSGGQALIAAILNDVDQANDAAMASAGILFNQHRIEDVKAPEPAVHPEEPATESAPAAEPDVSADQDATSDLDIQAFNNKIVSQLATLASDLTKTMRNPGPETSSEILAQCLECANWLSNQLSVTSEQHPEFLESVHTCQDAIDLMVLMQLEKQDDDTAVDAVSLLLQIKRDFEVKIAA